VVVLDVGPSMEPHLIHTKRALQCYLHSKLISKPLSAFGLVLFGTTDTSNQVYSEAVGGGYLDEYLHITTASPVQIPTLKTLRTVHNGAVLSVHAFHSCVVV
jgi:hypothetical protein